MLAQALAQTKSETITKSIEVKNRDTSFWFCVCNINGSVDVEAYEGNSIEVTIEKKVSARSQADVDLGMEELQLDIAESREFLRFSMISPNQQMIEKDDPLECGWNWNRDEQRRNYWYTIDYKVKVPKGISVKLSTVNKGDVFAKGVSGNIYAANVNGNVTLSEIDGDTKATTVNGKLEVSYVRMPVEFGTFNTVNGDIEVYVPTNGNGVFNFNTQWGKIYSDLDFSSKLVPQVKKTAAGEETKYKVSNSNSYHFGKSGGPSFEFETLNGNVYLRKQK